MIQTLNTRFPRPPLGALAVIATLFVTTLTGIGGSAPRAWAGAGADSLRLVSSPKDSAAAQQLIRPEKLARLLADSTAQQPAVLQVGFKFQFQSGHIPRSRFFGPAMKPEGLAALKKALEELPRRQAVVLYCGCCPWADCPNVRPAFKMVREMGFKDVRVLYVVKDLQHDWIDKGFSVTKGDR